MTTIDFIVAMFKEFLLGIVYIFLSPIVGFTKMFNFKFYGETISKYSLTNGGIAWLFVVGTFLVMLAVVVGLVLLGIFLVKRIIKVTRSFREQDLLLREVGRLDRELAYAYGLMDRKLVKFLKDKEEQLSKEMGYTESEGEIDYANSRFSKLITLDEKYETGNPETLNTEFTLKDVCFNFRHYAGSKLKLFYDEEIVREFVSSFAAVRLIILQGISGTGKTSLPYGFGKFLGGDGSFIQAIQPSWRERSEMLGFFNEFTKKYSEPEFLRNLYEAKYSNNLHLTVLDEMNIARVEYYFAEFLSVLEMPRPEEWIVELVSKVQEDDPKLLENGKLTLPANMWFVGTANNDDSTFAISDKVYDRAMIIDIDKKFTAFTPEEGTQMPIDYKVLMELFQKAIDNHPVSKENLDKLLELDQYVIEHFRVAFGNRIMKQLHSFVPAYIDCGGTEVDGIDFILVKKVFRKFAALNPNSIRDEIEGLISLLDSYWGEDNFPQSKEFLKRLRKAI